MNIVGFGDSIAHAFGLAECHRWTHIRQNLLDQWRPDTYQLCNCGCGGETTAAVHARPTPHRPIKRFTSHGRGRGTRHISAIRQNRQRGCRPIANRAGERNINVGQPISIG